MKQWEYKIVKAINLQSEVALDNLGKQGWELIKVRNSPVSCWDDEFIFKREKVER